MSYDSSSPLAQAMQDAAVRGSHKLLTIFYPLVIWDPARRILGTPRFLIAVGSSCSGIEGIALVTMFTVAWLVYARRELRIGRAIFLVPIAIGIMWLLNLVRLAVLVAIGDAGHPKIAMNGFHSEAGWIAFILVSMSFLVIAQRVGWFRRDAYASQQSVVLPQTHLADRNFAVIYLAPFLSILATSIVTHALSGGFEWLYPLRLVVAVLVLWSLRREYLAMDWRFGPLGVAAGLGVALLWVGEHMAMRVWHGPDLSGAPTALGLANLSPGMRVAWLVLRLSTAVLVVPIAEELAFRGFVARRLMSYDVESVPYARLSLIAVLISSVAFGLMHGGMIVMGIVAGVAFAAVARVRNRIGEAFAAHAIANLAIGIYVLASGDYSLW